MRCVGCGAEMILANVVRDDTMKVLGFEHHSFRCTKCHGIDRRLVFIKHGRQDDLEPLPVHLLLVPHRAPVPVQELLPAVLASVIKRHGASRKDR